MGPQRVPDSRPVYREYDVHRSGGEAYVLEKPSSRKERRESRELYSPLRDTPGLFLEFAELADREIDEEVWRDWIDRYGVLGLGAGPTPYVAAADGGPEETFSGFVREAQVANGVLRMWEAATAGLSDEEFVDRYYRHYALLQARAKGLFGVWYAEAQRSTPSPWMNLVASHVQGKLTNECYPLLVGAYDPAFEAAYGFRSLLGAMYLQMYWLMTAKGDVRRCKAPGCFRVITFEQPEQPSDPWTHNDRSRGYRTHVDKVFCSPACKQRDYDHRKRMSRG